MVAQAARRLGDVRVAIDQRQAGAAPGEDLVAIAKPMPLGPSGDQGSLPGEREGLLVERKVSATVYSFSFLLRI